MINQMYLKAIVTYCPRCGEFTWLVGKNAGRRADYKIKKGLQYRKIDLPVPGDRAWGFFAHRLAWLYMYGTLPSDDIDHIDRNGLNNRIANLRDVSRRINISNTCRERTVKPHTKKENTPTSDHAKSHIMTLVRTRQKWSYKDIESKFSIGPNTVSKLVKELLTEGVIRKEGRRFIINN